MILQKAHSGINVAVRENPPDLGIGDVVTMHDENVNRVGHVEIRGILVADSEDLGVNASSEITVIFYRLVE